MRDVLELLFRQSIDQPRQPIRDLRRIEFHADHTGRCRKNLRDGNIQPRGQCVARRKRNAIARCESRSSGVVYRR